MRKALSLMMVLLLSFMVLAACGGGGDKNKPAAGSGDAAKQGGGTEAAKTPAPAPAPTPVKETFNVSMAIGGTKSNLIFLPAVVADTMGFFKDEGINFTLKEYKGGTQAYDALVAGEVDTASMALEHVVKAQANGVDLVAAALYTKYPTVTVVVDEKLKDKVKTPADLKGMKIGVTSPGSGSHKSLLSILDKFGIKANEVEVIGVGADGMVEALATGKVQAVSGYDPQTTQIVREQKGYVLWDLRTKKDTEEIWGAGTIYPFVTMATRKEVIAKNPEMVQRVVKALVRANKYIATTPAEQLAAKLPVEVKGKDEALYIAALNANREALAADGLASDIGLQTVIAALKKEGVIPATADIKPAAVFDGTFARASGS